MYRALTEIPLPTEAHFVDKDVVQVKFSVRDNTRNVKRSVSNSIFLGSQSFPVAPAVDTGDVVAAIFAPASSVCFPRQAVFRETTDEKRYLEVWTGNTLELSTDVTSSHQSFYSEDFFSSFSFSHSDLALMYVAEANAPTEHSAKYKFTPTLGEGVAGRKRPTIFMFRWDASALPDQASLASVLPFVPEDHGILFGQAVFSPLNSRTIYATGYEYTRDGRLLGLKWCYNRPSGIWEIKLPSTSDETKDALTDASPTSLLCVSKKLTPSHLSCRSPRIHYDVASKRASLFWLSCASGGPHAGTFSLHSADISAAAQEISSRVLVDTVWEPRSDGFPGLYLDANLPLSPFVTFDDANFLVFSSVWGSRSTVLLVTEHGVVKDLTPDTDGTLFSWSVLATDGNRRFVCSRSSPTIPHEVLLGQLEGLGDVTWRVVSTPHLLPGVRRDLSYLSYSVISVPERGKTQTVVVRPSGPGVFTTPPCIHFIHGGPHNATTTAFSAEVAFLAIAGYTVSQPNYSGSIGFGETFVRSLLGNCGTLDVQDCIATVRHLVELGLSVDGKGKQFVTGGSHGGFLASHLIGQYPDVFTAAAIRNPVISTDPLSSDIPDWYFNEWNIEYPLYSSPEGYPARTSADVHALPPRRTPEQSQQIFKTSPIAYVDAVTAHVLLHLGGSDRRVTPTHGLEYYHALKGNARNLRPQQNIEMLWFEKEGHSLDSVEVKKIVCESLWSWFEKYRA
ncbi:Alpha/Beta hydrolase protein [Mycena pura]|uniref:acylaminoacyl-peptidase n=1 Tax=Mycena pura TaxID=153505 RepID=A0AAD6YNJ6_9AGAR|nr:Alpha/Beta hydrolase protein [Mycena pura]